MSSLSVVVPKITIANHIVNMIDGLYSLNDLHKASGGAKKHQPAFFMRNKETKELIDEIDRSANMMNGNKYKAVKRIQGGNDRSKQGTYVCKELVYRYAMWISPKFALLVIRTFDDVANGRYQPAQPTQLTPAQTQPLRDAVNVLVTKAGLLYPDAYKMVHRKFGVSHIKDLTVEQASLAVDYVHWLVLKVNSQNASIEADRVNAYALSVHMMYCKNWFDSVREPLEALSPDITSKVKGHFLEGMSAAKQLNRAICNS